MKYIYEFTVWPDEKGGFHNAIFELFEMLKMRLTKEATPEEFETFRETINHDGLTLREITRTPSATPETVL